MVIYKSSKWEELSYCQIRLDQSDVILLITKLIIAVNHITGSFRQPIKFGISTTEAALDIDSLTAFGIMRIGGEF